MDYILSSINQNIELRYENEVNDIIADKQARIEYLLILIMGYLWNKNFHKTKTSFQKELLDKLYKPTIGQIIGISKELDLEKEIFISNNEELLFKYKNIRDNEIGHKIRYTDGGNHLITQLDQCFNEILGLDIPIIKNKLNYVIVEKKNEIDGKFLGIMLTHEIKPKRWECPVSFEKLEVGHIYIKPTINSYFKISPFVHIENRTKIYLFQKMEEVLKGTIVYNRILEHENSYSKDWNGFLRTFTPRDNIKKITPNKTIINHFSPNYEKYIKVPAIQDKVNEYLYGERKNADTCITIWGHGGVGKTACVHAICHYLCHTKNKNEKFKYIIFFSAKDRFFDPKKGKLIYYKKDEQGNNIIGSFEEIISTLNLIIHNEKNPNPEKIIGYTGKFLLVIDDFETFEEDEQKKITNFIDRLNANFHKVIITTRNKILAVGRIIHANELTMDGTISFFLRVIQNDYSDNPNLKSIESDLLNKEISLEYSEKIQKITSGRPLFIIQFACLLFQNGGELVYTLADKGIRKISTERDAIEFLYGRLYKQLSDASKKIYCILGLITLEDNLRNSIEMAKYVSHMEKNRFNESLNELSDLRIIEVEDEIIYKVYYAEVLSMMKEKFGKLSKKEKHKYKDRFAKTPDRILDFNSSFLIRARKKKNAIEPINQIIESYKIAIDKEVSEKPENEILQVILELIQYISVNRADIKLAISTSKDFVESYPWLLGKSDYVSNYSELLWKDHDKVECVETLKSFFNLIKQKELNKENGSILLYISALIIWKTSECELEAINYKNERGLKSPGSDFENRENLNKIIEGEFASYLIDNIRNYKPDFFSKKKIYKSDIVKGLNRFVDLSYQVGRFSLGYEICQIAIKLFGTEEKQIFNRHLEKYHEWLQSGKVPKLEQQFNRRNIELKIYAGRIKSIDQKNGTGTIESIAEKGYYSFKREVLINKYFPFIKVGDFVQFLIEKDNNESIVSEVKATGLGTKKTRI